MKPERREFMLQLANLLQENNATLQYTRDEDGVHIVFDEYEDEEARYCIGFSNKQPELLRQHANNEED